MPYRVIQWGAGNVGVNALRQILQHPELELVGVLVVKPEKVGCDAGELCGARTLGVLAVNDPEELLKLKADCVCMAGFDPKIDDPAVPGTENGKLVDWICRFLAAGMNVVSVSTVPLVFPPPSWASTVERIEAACRAGGTTFFPTGLQPGLIHDLIPLTISGACERIDTIRLQGIFNWAAYNSPSVWAGGFGLTPDEFEARFPVESRQGEKDRSVRVVGPAMRTLAAGLGVEIQSLSTDIRYCLADEPFDVAAGRVEAGQIGAIHYEIAAVVNGKKRIFRDRYIRLNDKLAPDWPYFKGDGGGGYRVVIDGKPNFVMDLDFGGDDDDDPILMAALATAAMATNAIPTVCKAPPGYAYALDMPRTMARGLMSTD